MHLATFLDAYNFAKRLKSLRGLTPFERICQLWTEQPERFRLNPLHHMAGLNILASTRTRRASVSAACANIPEVGYFHSATRSGPRREAAALGRVLEA